MADLRLWFSRPSVADLQNSSRRRYSSEGSANVCSRDTIGNGSVGGSFKVLAPTNGSVVDETPWSVNGKSRSKEVSEGSISPQLFARRVDLRDTSLFG
jgi:hypothetical protein